MAAVFRLTSLILLQDADGKQRDTWGTIAIRVIDLAITPDSSRLIAVGMHELPPSPVAEARAQSGDAPPAGGNGAAAIITQNAENRILIYDLATKQLESCVCDRLKRVRADH